MQCVRARQATKTTFAGRVCPGTAPTLQRDVERIIPGRVGKVPHLPGIGAVPGNSSRRCPGCHGPGRGAPWHYGHGTRMVCSRKGWQKTAHSSWALPSPPREGCRLQQDPGETDRVRTSRGDLAPPRCQVYRDADTGHLLGGRGRVAAGIGL